MLYKKHCLLSYYNYVRSGYIFLGHSTLNDAGSFSYGWSRQSHPEVAYAYGLSVYNADVNPSHVSNRHTAFRVLTLNPNPLPPQPRYSCTLGLLLHFTLIRKPDFLWL